MQVRVLGPLEVDADGQRLRLTGQLRVLLLVLAMSADHAVSVERLITALWEDRALPTNPRWRAPKIPDSCLAGWYLVELSVQVLVVDLLRGTVSES